MPYPLEKGDKLRLYHQLVDLHQHFQICLIALSDQEVDSKSTEALLAVVDELLICQISRKHSYFNAFRSIFTEKPIQVGLYTDDSLISKVRSFLSRWQPDVVHCQLFRMAEYSKALPYPAIIDYMDAFGVGMLRRAEAVHWPYSWLYRLEAHRTIRYEQSINPYFQQHVVITSNDAELIGLTNYSVIRNGIDMTDFAYKGSETSRPYDIGFVGNMGYIPNEHAAIYLISKVAPKLSDDIKIGIFGARPTRKVKNLASKNITISGWLDDIKSAYWDSKLMVAPIFQGTGQQNKILEAMACGTPVITTSEVNQGIGASHGEQLWIADDPDDFAFRIQYALDHPAECERIRRNALTFVKQNFSWNQCNQSLRKLIEDTCKY